MSTGLKYVQINSHYAGWPQEVVFGLHRRLQNQGITSYVFYGNGPKASGAYESLVCSKWERYFAAAQTRIDGKMGFHSKRATKRLIRLLDEIQPDVVHLHSPIGYYLNVEMLFNWLAASDCEFKWTLHDCWAFTGLCLYFTLAQCDQWKTQCTLNCPRQPGDKLPDFGMKRSVDWNYKRKRELFTMLPEDRVTLITPSRWLADLVGESFLSKYKVEVVPNTINKEVFKPKERFLRHEWGVDDKFVVLGVASRWGYRKGLQDFERLVRDLDERYAIVMAGLTDKQREQFPSDCGATTVLLPRIWSRDELADVYSAADVFFNPTYEENYPTVNLESQACGTPVITYDTGGCRETIEAGNGYVVAGYDEAVAQVMAMHDGGDVPLT